MRRTPWVQVVAGYLLYGDRITDYANSFRFCEDHHDDWESTNEAIACRIDLSMGPNKTVGKPGSWPHMDFLTTGGEGCSPYSPSQNGTFSAPRVPLSVTACTRTLRRAVGQRHV